MAFYLLHQICQVVTVKIAPALKKGTVDVCLEDVNVLLKHASAEKIVSVDITALVEAIVLASRLITNCILGIYENNLPKMRL